MQLKKFNERTRISISNLLDKIINGKSAIGFRESHREEFYRVLIAEFYCESVSNFYYSSTYIFDMYQKHVENTIMHSSFSDVLTLMEFFIHFCSKRRTYDSHSGMVFINKAVEELFNQLFEKEYVGYRFIDGKAIPITDEIEQKAIEQSLDTQFAGCKSQIQKALGFLSDRDHPDYKNSIKESISAVESICQIITNDNHATLGEALKLLENKGITLHPALKKAFSSIYGYTSDEGGIRHAEGMFESNVTFEEAKYMLVSCCAFVNFLTAEMGKMKNA